jgi:hypothetical protein
MENLATICGKCNVRKNARTVNEHLQRYPLRKVRAKYGEPIHWDGLSHVFLVLASSDPLATQSDWQWLRALRQ